MPSNPYRFRQTIPEGTEAIVTESPSGEFISARHIDCEDA